MHFQALVCKKKPKYFFFDYLTGKVQKNFFFLFTMCGFKVRMPFGIVFNDSTRLKML